MPGPALAIDSSPGLSCFSSKFSSSKFSPYMESPPLQALLYQDQVMVFLLYNRPCRRCLVLCDVSWVEAAM